MFVKTGDRLFLLSTAYLQSMVVLSMTVETIPFGVIVM